MTSRKDSSSAKNIDNEIDAIAEAPEWRSVAINPGPRETLRSPFGGHATIPKPPRVGFNSSDDASNEVIDKNAFFNTDSKTPPVDPAPTTDKASQSSNWTPVKLRPVPAFYPLEKSSRFVDDMLNEVAARISECLRVSSVQAIYDNETATANLMTAENLEMHLSLWDTSEQPDHPDGIVVELQRRKGDSITFHRYSRHILDAAIGDFDLPQFVLQNGTDIDREYSRKVERLLSMQHDAGDENENAIIAIEIAHGLLMKDRMDARQLGLESLCLLTDPRKTGKATAMIASKIVLLGTAQDSEEQEGIISQDGMVFDETPFQEIRETVLSLIQLRRIGDEGEFSDDDTDSEDEYDGATAAHANNKPEESEHITLLHNLALAVLANALDVMENYEAYASDIDKEQEDTKMPANRVRADTSDSIASKFMEDAKDFTNLEILSTLIQELGKAQHKPHNACLSAKCLRSLCGASDDAQRRAKELGAKNVVNTALDVGVKTHAKLEKECKLVVKVLTATTTDNDNTTTSASTTTSQPPSQPSDPQHRQP